VSRSARRSAAAAAENTAKWLHEYRELPAKREELVRLRATSLPLSHRSLLRRSRKLRHGNAVLPKDAGVEPMRPRTRPSAG